jgi:hypothetical protein
MDIFLITCIEGDDWLILTPPGNYIAAFSLQATPSEGDPFNPGNYQVIASKYKFEVISSKF